jgi:DNA-directed RNA polymerase subunit M/transcription elongation factor TFIIS
MNDKEEGFVFKCRTCGYQSIAEDLEDKYPDSENPSATLICPKCKSVDWYWV